MNTFSKPNIKIKIPSRRKNWRSKDRGNKLTTILNFRTKRIKKNQSFLLFSFASLRIKWKKKQINGNDKRIMSEMP